MSNQNEIAVAGADGGGKRNRQVTVFPNRDTITNYQIQTLLGIMGQCLYGLVENTREIGIDPLNKRPELDGGVVAAAAATFIHACDRLDKIIADESRWTMEIQNVLEKQLSENYAQNLELLKAQTTAANQITSPSFRFRPAIIKIHPGFAAILGDLHDLDNCIMGVGASPKEALDNFDRKFNGIESLPSNFAEWLMKRETDIAQGKPLDPPPDMKGTNEASATGMDETGSRTGKKTPRRGKNPRRNRKGPGKKS